MTNGKGFLDQFNKPAPAAAEPVAEEPVAATLETKEPIASEPVAEEAVVKKPIAKDLEPNAVEKEAVKDAVKNEILELNDDSVIEYLKSKGKEVSSIDDLFKKPEAQKDPLEGLSDEVKKIIEFSRDTNGRPLKDYLELNKDYKSLPPIDLARAKAMEATKGKLSAEEIDQYLEKKLNIDLTYPDEMDKFDSIELENYSEDYLSKKLTEQQKYGSPADKGSNDNIVELENGMSMDKGAYAKFEKERELYHGAVIKAVDGIADFSIKIKIDDNGSSSEYEIPYQHSKEDKHKMVSYTSDISATVNQLFDTPEGFNHEGLSESMPWIDKEYREKMITAIVHKALAQRTEDILADEHNINFSRKRIPTSKDGKKIVPIPGTTNPYGVKFNF